MGSAIAVYYAVFFPWPSSQGAPDLQGEKSFDVVLGVRTCSLKPFKKKDHHTTPPPPPPSRP